jgi:hypothetical protein
MHFLSVDDHVGWGRNAETNLIPVEAHDGDDDVVAYAQ